MKETKINQSKNMTNHIEEYFADSSQSKEVITSKELFRANKEDVDVKTDIILQEIQLLNKLVFNNEHLKSKGLKPIYTNFLNQYMRLKISLDRKSRMEFVDMNRSQQKPEDMLQNASNVSNILGAKK